MIHYSMLGKHAHSRPSSTMHPSPFVSPLDDQIMSSHTKECQDRCDPSSGCPSSFLNGGRSHLCPKHSSSQDEPRCFCSTHSNHNLVSTNAVSFKNHWPAHVTVASPTSVLPSCVPFCLPRFILSTVLSTISFTPSSTVLSIISSTLFYRLVYHQFYCQFNRQFYPCLPFGLLSVLHCDLPSVLQSVLPRDLADLLSVLQTIIPSIPPDMPRL